MKEKARAIFDSKVTWLGIGSFVGTMFGDQAAAIANALGALVMAVL